MLQTGTAESKANEQQSESELTKIFKYVSSIPATMMQVSRSCLTSNSDAELECHENDYG
jgi:hypothetical protein